MTITQLIIKRPTLVVVLFTVLTLLGIMSYMQLNYDLFPKMNIPVISVITQYPGAAASEVENSVTKKLEDALSSLEKMKDMQSTSQEGLSSITIELESSADVDLIIQDAQRKINAIQTLLPVDAKAPSINKFSSDDLPIMNLGVTAKMEPTRLYQITKDQIKARLSKLNGVGQVSLVGGEEREIKINVSKSKLDVYKLSISWIYQAVGNANMEFPTGKIEDDTKQYTVRLSGKIKSLDNLRNIIVSKSASGSAVKLSDVAEIVDGTAEQNTLNRINGVNSIGLVIQKQSDANAVNVSRLVKKEITAIEKDYSSCDLKFNIASDNSTYTLASANEVFKDLLYAILLVSLVMFFFLHSIRNAFIVMVSIPSSIISVFIAMYVFHFTLNMMTLLALALIIGILVDDSIVVLENIHRHLKMGKDRKQAAVDGRSEIGFTAVAITMVDVVVFLPLSLVGGMIGNMLREFALVVVFSTLMSLFVSFTVTPLLASQFSRIEQLTKGTLMGKLAIGFEGLFNGLLTYYESILRWGLKHRRTVYGIVFTLIVLAFSLIPSGFIGTEFIASGDKGEFIIKLEGEPQNTLYQMNMLTQKVEDMLLKKPEVVKVFSNVGYSSSSMMASGSSEYNKAEITVTLVSKEKRKQSVDEYAAMMKKEISAIPGLKVTSSPVSITGGSQESAIQILLRGPETEKLYNVADSVMLVVKSVQGTGDIKLSVEKSKPEMQIILNRDKMALLGLSVNDVGSTLRLAFSGNSNMQYSEKGVDYNINLKLDQFNRKKIEDIGSLTFLNNQGNIIELRDFAAINQSIAPNKLERYDRISSLTVNASAIGRPLGTVGQEIKKAIHDRIHSGDVSIEFKGQMERQSEAFGSLFLAILAALALVYLVMVALYNSYLRPFVVFFSIPVAAIGALLALALTRSTLSIFSIIGLLMLIGLVCKNAILLVDFTNQLREKGHGIIDALVEAGKVRLRPILMTTFSMVFGMLPIALATAEGAEVKNGMAWVIIGGLLSSLLLTLVLVPAVYATMESLKVKAQWIFSKKKSAKLAAVADESI
jgi:hydrophobic/amphiphilic exporter-1 (mainly G- bacteria), HAE1 family